MMYTYSEDFINGKTRNPLHAFSIKFIMPLNWSEFIVAIKNVHNCAIETPTVFHFEVCKRIFVALKNWDHLIDIHFMQPTTSKYCKICYLIRGYHFIWYTIVLLTYLDISNYLLLIQIVNCCWKWFLWINFNQFDDVVMFIPSNLHIKTLIGNISLEISKEIACWLWILPIT